MSLGHANQLSLSIYAKVVSRDCLGTLFFQTITIERKKVMKVGTLRFMTLQWANSSTHYFVYIALWSVQKSEKCESIAICEVRGEKGLNYTCLAALVYEI